MAAPINTASSPGSIGEPTAVVITPPAAMPSPPSAGGSGGGIPEAPVAPTEIPVVAPSPTNAGGGGGDPASYLPAASTSGTTSKATEARRKRKADATAAAALAAANAANAVASTPKAGAKTDSLSLMTPRKSIMPPAASSGYGFAASAPGTRQTSRRGSIADSVSGESVTSTKSDEAAASAAAAAAATATATAASQRSLGSDVTVQEAYDLLLKIRESGKLFREFTEEDISIIAEVFSVIAFKANEHVIEQNEEATFCGVCLRGTFTVIIGDMTVELQPGQLLGEISLFEGGVRTADVIASSNPAVLAVFAFSELDKLKDSSTDLLRYKIISMFATEGIRKLREVNQRQEKQIDRMKTGGAAAAPAPDSALSPSNSSAAAAVDESTLTEDEKAKRETIRQVRERQRAQKKDNRSIQFKAGGGVMTASGSSGGGTSGGAGRPSAAPVSKGSAVREVEALYRFRLAQTKIQTKEKMELHESKRDAAEHKLRTFRVMLDNRDKQLKEATEQLQKYTDQCEKLTLLNTQLEKKLKSDEDLMFNSLIHKKKLEKDMVQLQADYAKLENLEKEMEVRMQELNTQWIAKMGEQIKETAGRDKRIEEMKEEAHRLHDKHAATVHKLKEQLHHEHKIATKDLTHNLDKHEKHIDKVEKQNLKLRFDLDETLKHNEYLRNTLQSIKKEKEAIAEQQRKADFFLSKHKRIIGRLEDTLSRHAAMASHYRKYADAYEQVLRYTCINFYVKMYRNRKFLVQLITLISTIAAKAHAEVAKEKKTPNNLNQRPQTPYAVFKPKNVRGWLNSQKMSDLLTKAREEFSKLSDFTTDLLQFKNYWHDTADSFFERTIELKQNVLTTAQQHTVTSAHTATVESQYRDLVGRHELLQKEYESQAGVHRLQVQAIKERLLMGAKKFKEKKAEISVLTGKLIVLKRRIRELETAARKQGGGGGGGGAGGSANAQPLPVSGGRTARTQSAAAAAAAAANGGGGFYYPPDAASFDGSLSMPPPMRARMAAAASAGDIKSADGSDSQRARTANSAAGFQQPYTTFVAPAGANGGSGGAAGGGFFPPPNAGGSPFLPSRLSATLPAGGAGQPLPPPQHKKTKSGGGAGSAPAIPHAVGTYQHQFALSQAHATAAQQLLPPGLTADGYQYNLYAATGAQLNSVQKAQFYNPTIAGSGGVTSGGPPPAAPSVRQQKAMSQLVTAANKRA